MKNPRCSCTASFSGVDEESAMLQTAPCFGWSKSFTMFLCRVCGRLISIVQPFFHRCRYINFVLWVDLLRSTGENWYIYISFLLDQPSINYLQCFSAAPCFDWSKVLQNLQCYRLLHVFAGLLFTMFLCRACGRLISIVQPIFSPM